MTSARTVKKVRTLWLALQAAHVLEAQRKEEWRVSALPSADWRYMQSYLSPDVLLHLDETMRQRGSMYDKSSIGFILIPESEEWVNASEVDLEVWLSSSKELGFGEAIDVLRSRVPNLKSRDGKRKAGRLIDELTAILSGD